MERGEDTKKKTGMRGWGLGRQKDRQRTPVSFAIVSDHLTSFSILYMMCSWRDEQREADGVSSDHDTFPDRREYHTLEEKDLFEPR